MTATYAAACKIGLGEIELREFEMPEPAAGEVLVRVDRVAICGSDLHAIFDGIGYLAGDDSAPLPGSPGHEGVGTVLRSAAEGFVPDDHVLLLSPGSYAELMVTSASQCVKLPSGAPLDRMVMTQSLGVTCYAMRLFWPETRPRGGTATLIGAGSIGLHFVQLLRLRGFETLIVSDTLPARLKMAENLGADLVVRAPDQSVVAATMDATGGAGADLVVEAAGYDVTRAQAIQCVRPLGRVGLFGYPETTSGLSPFPFADAFWKAPVSIEIVKGAQEVDCLPDFHEAIRLICDGTVSVEHLLGTEFPLADIRKALRAARNREAIKVQLLPPSST